MGDADVRRNLPVLPMEQVTGVLDALDDDLTYLHDTVHVLEQQTIRALSVQIRGYSIFRRFFLAMNFVMLPILVAIGLCYTLKEMPVDEEFEPLLQGAIMIMLYITGGIGVPLYLGTLWAIYSFSVNPEITNDDIMRSLFLDENISTLPSDSSGLEGNDNAAFISDSDDEYVMLPDESTIMSQTESNVKPIETHSLSDLSVHNKAEILQVKDDAEERPISS